MKAASLCNNEKLLPILYHTFLNMPPNETLFYPSRKQHDHFTPAFLLQNNFCEFTTREHRFKR